MTRFPVRRAAAGLVAIGLFALPADADRGRSHDTGVRGHWSADHDKHLYGGRRGPQTRLVAWEHPHFRGRAIELDRPVHSLSRQRIGLNDSISSIAVRGGVWEVCADPNFTGRCRIIRGEETKLSYIRMNDTITSLRPLGRKAARRYGYAGHGWRRPARRGHGPGLRGHERYGARADGGITLFADPYFRGRSYALDRADTYLKYRGANDTVSSIRVDYGVWEVCVDPGFRGRCEIVDASVGKLSPFGLDDNISSVRPLREARHARRPGWRR